MKDTESLFSSLLIEVLKELVTLAGRDDVEWADDIRRKIERLRQAGPLVTLPSSLYADRSREDAEMWCDRCERRHGVVWVAPSDLWNAVMRESDRGKPDEFGFCCPICFMQLADERGVGNGMWDVSTWIAT